MIERISAQNINTIINPSFRSYAQRYIDIEKSFRKNVEQFGLPFAQEEASCKKDRIAVCEREGRPLITKSLGRRSDKILRINNDGKSISSGWLSDACINCRLGLHAKTFLISLQCPRKCFFCFNFNQVDYVDLRTGIRDASAELTKLHTEGVELTHLALSGGEPLLHKEEALNFFRVAARLYPRAHKRLYTCGAFVNEELLLELREIGLNEIRFSIKSEDAPAELDSILCTIGQAVGLIEAVVVEMPVIPGEGAFMEDLLVKLDALGVKGINLLELGYPLANAAEFLKRGLLVKHDPYRVLYDYSYAGGLPISGSEETCLALLEFALDAELKMGIHYCSMENKLSGQVFQQNRPFVSQFPTCIMSTRDHYFKSAKVFGEDARQIAEVLASKPLGTFRVDEGFGMLEFHPAYISELAETFPEMEIAIGYGIVESRDGERLLRELRIDKTTPSTFAPEIDL